MDEYQSAQIKMQKTQMYLQMISVFMSAVLLYTLITTKKEASKALEELTDNEDEL